MLQELTSLTLRWKHRRWLRKTRLRRAAVFAWLPDDTVRDVSATRGAGFYALPSVARTGESVAFHGGTADRSRIWATDIEDGTTRPLTPPSMVACSPSYSADGAQIAFSGYELEGHRSYSMEEAVHQLPGMGLYFGGAPYWMNLYVMRSDGSALRKITGGWFSDTRPTFSPDGTHIVFLRRSSWPWGPRRMWRAWADGSREPEPLGVDTSAGRPVYSVDGAWIYFFTSAGGRNRLAVVPSDGGEWRPLENDELGEWSHGPFPDPDGSHIWYHSSLGGGSLCRLPLDGGKPSVMRPPGFENRQCTHASVSQGGIVAFDSVDVEWISSN